MSTERRWGLGASVTRCLTALVLAAALWQTAGSASAESLPREPTCLGSGGPCEGVILKSGGPPVQKITETNRKGGLIELQAPASVTSVSLTTPTACGEQECVYNHWDWIPSSTHAVVVKRGCAENQTFCIVKVPRGERGWAPVLLNLDSYPAMVYLVHLPKEGDVTLSGTVLERKCEPDALPPAIPHQCGLLVVPARGVPMSVSGDGSAQTRTAADGSFSFVVPQGRHTVAPGRGVGATKPSSLTVDAHSDVGQLNFSVCRPPSGYAGPKPHCALVEIDGSVVDVEGAPYAGAEIQGADDATRADGNGDFVLWTAPGTVSVIAKDTSSILPANELPSASATVHAREPGARVRLVIHPLFVPTQTDSSVAMAFAIGGLPVKTSQAHDELAISSQNAGLSVVCARGFTLPITLVKPRNATASVNAVVSTGGTQGFCPGFWTGQLFGSNGKLLYKNSFSVS